jgi:ketopantoate reductase
MNGERKTDYLIFGAGALGSVIGGRLQETGCSVAYVSRGASLQSGDGEGLENYRHLG